MNEASSVNQLQRFREVVARLRDPENGCPWDLRQTHRSLKKYFLEEVYEFLDEVDHSNCGGMEEELGDVLLQIYLHAQLLEESTEGQINLQTIAGRICDKIIRRHPHVFDPDFNREDFCLETSWQEIKSKEKVVQATSELFTKYQALPPLQRVEKIYKEIKAYGFKFRSPDHALEKIDEELEEFRESLTLGDEDKQREEFADILMSVYSAAIEYGYSPEELTHFSMNKFRRRWICFEAKVIERQIDLQSLDYDAKRSLWDEAKREC